MSIAALLIALVALIVALTSLSLVLLIFREFARISLAYRDLERPIAQTTSERDSGEQGTTTRIVDAANQSVATPFLSVPDLSPEVLAPSLGQPPIPKGGFGTRIVVKRR